MAEKRIADIDAEQVDDAGNEIVCLYAKSPPDYAVYRNPQRVSVQFADDKAKARRQRMAIAGLNPLRGQISGLIDGWHTSTNPAKQSRANRYDRRVADAMIMGLEGGVADALALLTEIRDDIVAERRSIAQTDYLVWAAGVGILFISLLALVSSGWFDRIHHFPDFASTAWTGAAGGTIGAFFSIAIGLRSRTVLVDLQQWDNRRDAILRVAVGTIGGGILICLLLTKVVQFTQISDKLLSGKPPEIMLTALVVGFLAGFSERAVPDLLSKASLATDAKVGDTTDVAGDQARMAVAVSAQNAGQDDQDEDEDDSNQPDAAADADDCLCDAPPQPVENLTRDEDLPPSAGGVSPDVPPPAAAPPGQPEAAADAAAAQGAGESPDKGAAGGEERASEPPDGADAPGGAGEQETRDPQQPE